MKHLQPYLPGGSAAITKAVERGRKTNRERDKLDGLDHAPMDMLLRTAISAIYAGLLMMPKDKAGGWECIGEGIAMIQDAEMQCRRVDGEEEFLSVAAGVSHDGLPVVALSLMYGERYVFTVNMSTDRAGFVRGSIGRALESLDRHAEGN